MATILVVDDSALIRSMLQKALTGEGFNVITAADGQAGLALIESRALDLIISDVQMPVLSGLQLLRALREGQEYRTIPFLLMSSDYHGRGFLAQAVLARRPAGHNRAAARRRWATGSGGEVSTPSSLLAFFHSQ